MKLLIAISSAFLLSACMPPKWVIPENTVVSDYDTAKTEQEFWLRYMELSAQAEKVDINKLTPAYRECVADEMTQLSTPELSGAIDKFLHSYRYDDYYDMVDAMGDFAGDFKKTHGLEPLYYAGDTCTARGVKAINS